MTRKKKETPPRDFFRRIMDDEQAALHDRMKAAELVAKSGEAETEVVVKVEYV